MLSQIWATTFKCSLKLSIVGNATCTETAKQSYVLFNQVFGYLWRGLLIPIPCVYLSLYIYIHIDIVSDLDIYTYISVAGCSLHQPLHSKATFYAQALLEFGTLVERAQVVPVPESINQSATDLASLWGTTALEVGQESVLLSLSGRLPRQPQEVRSSCLPLQHHFA